MRLERFHFPFVGPGGAACAFALLLAGCASFGPSSGDDSAAADVEARPAAIAEDAPERALPHIDVTDISPAKPIDLTDAPGDLFERIRDGFSMPELDDDLVRTHQQSYLERPDYLRRMVERGRLYLHHVVEELDKRGMPMELALLPMVESAYNPMAYSSAKASGLWQFIPSTGRRYNLDQDWWKDERRDIVASTAAALEYLQMIYDMFGDWHLALASYNCGEGAVARAIEKNRAQGLPADYQSLTLPGETRNYVPKLQALKNIFRDPALMATLELPYVPDRPYFATFKTDSHIDVELAARLAEMPVEEFVALNPAHKRPVIMADTPLVIPAEKLETFVNNLDAYSDKKRPLSSWQTYTLQPGDRLENVAPRFGMSVANLKAVNGIRGRLPLPPGLTLLVPGSGGASDFSAISGLTAPPEYDPRPAARVRTHVVRKGETLASLARRYGIPPREIRRINRLKSDRIAVGMRLQFAAAPAREPARSAANVRGAKTAKAASPGGRVSVVLRRGEKPVVKSGPRIARYTVRRGDTIYSIARRFNVAAEDLMRSNRVRPETLKAGTTLTIRLAERS